MASRWQTGDVVEIRIPHANSGRTVRIGAFIGHGATADVFEATDDAHDPELAHIALKIYKIEPPSDLEDFVEHARTNQLDKIPPLLIDDGNQMTTEYSPVAAPIFVIYGHRTDIVGVAVLRIDSNRFVPLSDFTRTPLVRDLSVTVYAAQRLAKTVKHIHERGYIIGDFSDTNILIDRAGYVSLIDCDPYGTEEPSRSARDATVNWRAPETALALEASQKSDLFILAVHCLKLLLGGASPFDGVDPQNDTNSPQANIDSGRSWLWIEEMRVPGPQFESSRGMKDLPDYLAEAILNLLSQDPQDRRSTAVLLEKSLIRCRQELFNSPCGHTTFRSIGCTTCRSGTVSSVERLVAPPTRKRTPKNVPQAGSQKSGSSSSQTENAGNQSSKPPASTSAPPSLNSEKSPLPRSQRTSAFSIWALLIALLLIIAATVMFMVSK